MHGVGCAIHSRVDIDESRTSQCKFSRLSASDFPALRAANFLTKCPRPDTLSTCTLHVTMGVGSNPEVYLDSNLELLKIGYDAVGRT